MSYTESVLPDVLSRSSEMVEKASVEEEGGDSASGGSAHTSTTIFLCISRPPTTWRSEREAKDDTFINPVLLQAVMANVWSPVGENGPFSKKDT